MKLLPRKNIRISESIIGVAAVLINLISINNTANIDDLWERFKSLINTVQLPAQHDYNSFVLGLDFLYIVGKISSDEEGNIRLCI